MTRISQALLGTIMTPITVVAGTKTIFLESGTSWECPLDWNNSNNYIIGIGAGGGGGYGSSGWGAGGGGGGAFAIKSNVS